MKQNAENSQTEDNDQQPDLHVVESPRQGGGAKAVNGSATRNRRSLRPEIAVLGWNVRSYRLSLRASKV